MTYTGTDFRTNNVSLEEFLPAHGEKYTRSGKEYRWQRHYNLTIRENKWFLYSQTKCECQINNYGLASQRAG